MKKFLVGVGVIAFFLVSIVFFKDPIIKLLGTKVTSDVLGAPVHMDSLTLNLSNSTIHISGFKIYNPEGFPQGVLAYCPSVDINYDKSSVFKEKQHFFSMDIDLKDMGITKDKQGKLNVDALKIVRQSKFTPVQIDVLNLKLDKIVYKDYTVGVEPSIKVYKIKRHQRYKGIPSVEQLALLVLAEPMKAAAIRGATIYGVAALAGVAILPEAVPAVVAVTFIGKDSVRKTSNVSFDHMYGVSFDTVKRMGKVTKFDVARGEIKADIDGSLVSVKLRKKTNNKTEITISARKLMFPKPEIAGGVLYQILYNLK